jgi:hypothetical protein
MKNEMIRKNIGIILMIISTFLLSGGIVYYSFKKSKVCDELVILNDGSQFEATDVLSYRSGMSTIKMCNGQWMDTPTVNIKMVKPIEK